MLNKFPLFIVHYTKHRLKEPEPSTCAEAAEASVRLELPPLLRVPANEPVTMNCEFELPRQPAIAGDSPTDFEVEWRLTSNIKNDSHIKSERLEPNPEGVLECSHTIAAVRDTDEGTYCCSVQPYGSPEPLSTRTLLLVLHSPPATQSSRSSEKTATSNKRGASSDNQQTSSIAKKQPPVAKFGDGPPSDEPVHCTCPPTTTQSMLQIVCEPGARPLGMSCTQETMSDSGVTEASDPFERAPESLQSHCARHVDQKTIWSTRNGFAREVCDDKPELPQKLCRKRAMLPIEDFQVRIALASRYKWFFSAQVD